MRIVSDLKKVDIPPLIRDGCSATHTILTSTFERYHVDLSETDATAVAFSKSIKMIIESMDTNLSLLKGLKNTEAKKYEKEVLTLQTKFGKVMDTGKKMTSIENEVENLEREVSQHRSRKVSYSKNSKVDIEAAKDRIELLRQTRDRFNKEFQRVKEEMEVQNSDFNESRKYIVTKFNAHTESIDSRLTDNIEFYNKKLADFAHGLKLGTPQHSYEDSLASPFADSTRLSIENKQITSNTEPQRLEDVKPRRLVATV